MNGERLHLDQCKICGTDIPFGVHCEDCVRRHRVCQMCDADISHRDYRAQTCETACKEARKRGRRRIERELMGNVPNQTLEMIGELITRVEVLEDRQENQDNAIGALIAVQTETNRQLASLGEKLDFFLDKLSSNLPVMDMIPRPASPPSPEPELIITHTTDTNSAKNFIASMMALQS